MPRTKTLTPPPNNELTVLPGRKPDHPDDILPQNTLPEGTLRIINIRADYLARFEILQDLAGSSQNPASPAYVLGYLLDLAERRSSRYAQATQDQLPGKTQKVSDRLTKAAEKLRQRGKGDGDPSDEEETE